MPKIEIPSDLYDHIEVHAKNQKTSVEELVVRILQQCRGLDLFRTTVDLNDTEQWAGGLR